MSDPTVNPATGAVQPLTAEQVAAATAANTAPAPVLDPTDPVHAFLSSVNERLTSLEQTVAPIAETVANIAAGGLPNAIGVATEVAEAVAPSWASRIEAIEKSIGDIIGVFQNHLPGASAGLVAPSAPKVEQ